MDITELLAFSVRNKASDLHLSAGMPPLIRVHGDVKRINLPSLSPPEIRAMLDSIMSAELRKRYDELLEVDFSFELPGHARFRVNAFHQDRGPAALIADRAYHPRTARDRPPGAPHPHQRPVALDLAHAGGGFDLEGRLARQLDERRERQVVKALRRVPDRADGAQRHVQAQRPLPPGTAGTRQDGLR